MSPEDRMKGYEWPAEVVERTVMLFLVMAVVIAFAAAALHHGVAAMHAVFARAALGR